MKSSTVSRDKKYPNSILMLLILIGSLSSFMILAVVAGGFPIRYWLRVPLDVFYISVGVSISFFLAYVILFRNSSLLLVLSFISIIYIVNSFFILEDYFPTTAWIHGLVIQNPTFDTFDYFGGVYSSEAVTYRVLPEILLGYLVRPFKFNSEQIYLLLKAVSLMATLGSLYCIARISREFVGSKINWLPAAYVLFFGMAMIGWVSYSVHDRFSFFFGISAVESILHYKFREGKPAQLIRALIFLCFSFTCSIYLSSWFGLSLGLALLLDWVRLGEVDFFEMVWMAAVLLAVGLVAVFWYRLGSIATTDSVYDYVLKFVFSESYTKMFLFVLSFISLFFVSIWIHRLSDHQPLSVSHRFLARMVVGSTLCILAVVSLGYFIPVFSPFVGIWHRLLLLSVMFLVGFVVIPALPHLCPKLSQTYAIVALMSVLALGGYETIRVEWLLQKSRLNDYTAFYRCTEESSLEIVLTRAQLQAIQDTIPKGSRVIVDSVTCGSGLLQFWANLYTPTVWSESTHFLNKEQLDRDDQLVTDIIFDQENKELLTKKAKMQQLGADYVILNRRTIGSVLMEDPEGEGFDIRYESPELQILSLKE